jgi:Heterokaryon incompatibility protein (HET)
MRLLQHSSTGEFSLTKDLVGDDRIPPYAILSHTWGSDTNEVTFEDVANGTGRDKAGFEKIRFCGEQARRDSLQYSWIDTCCINKATIPSSRRLSTLCFAGIRMRLNAMSIYQMFRQLRGKRAIRPPSLLGNQLFKKVDGLKEVGRSKNFLH